MGDELKSGLTFISHLLISVTCLRPGRPLSFHRQHGLDSTDDHISRANRRIGPTRVVILMNQYTWARPMCCLPVGRTVSNAPSHDPDVLDAAQLAGLDPWYDESHELCSTKRHGDHEAWEPDVRQPIPRFEFRPRYTTGPMYSSPVAHDT